MMDVNAAAGSGFAKIGTAQSRIDGAAKVTGAARYASDAAPANLAHAFLVTSAIARGGIDQIDTSKARAIPGVLEILTWENTKDELHDASFFAEGGYSGTTILPLRKPEVHHHGEIVALVVADSFEIARDAARRIDVTYAPRSPASGFDSDGAETEEAKKAAADSGDVDQAYEAAPVKIDARYETPTQHHNAIEFFATVCEWQGDQLTIYEPTQHMYGLKYGAAEQLGIDAAKIRTIAHFTGGAFGARGSIKPHTALVAIAAKRVGRPVKLMPTRAQGFTIATYRAETRQRVRLGAGRDGRLRSLTHEGWEVTSRPDAYSVAGTSTTTRMYACANTRARVHMVHADRNTPGFMRAPPEVPYMFALESAMDELAAELGMDPIELRRVNDTDKDPINGHPYSSRALMPCFDAAAKAFGWSRRDARPGSMRDGDWLIGWGCATSCYPTQIAPAAARVRITPDGQVLVQTAAQEIGTGIITIIGITAADRLGVPLDNVAVEAGDSRLPPAPVAGGSNSSASICNAVAAACEQIRARVALAAVQANDGVFAGQDSMQLSFAEGMLRGPHGAEEPLDLALSRLHPDYVEGHAENIPQGVSPEGIKKLHQGHTTFRGGPASDDTEYAFGAEFVEVRVHAQTREIRVPRMVGAFAFGQVLNPKTARSQLFGGMIWGLGSALLEATEIDPHQARYMNTNLADYLIAVNADVPSVDIIMLPEQDDKVNPMGIKGIGELGIVGTNAAIANAVFHATGKRIRRLPIRLEDLL
jgi:xanthine dehydrogenase YagR molybdenum-binding subunit